MQTGLLWFDNSTDRDLATKVADAARRYWEKFGVSPNTCYVNRAALAPASAGVTLPGPGTPGGSRLVLRVLPASNVLLHHFWIGIEEQAELREAA
ncbi:MAG: hypothetical protein CVU38_12705 [Chloroflexi bacterium HGW-Chloroflexi-1]|nr:MAG: hypothetical protein CVU38_12705 [Chloroflexi bacterium HGW-Chloroflexi-1]